MDAKLHVILAVIVLMVLPLTVVAKKHCILQPLSGQLVDDHVKQPSGLTFSELTNRLYMICDTKNCNYIYEFDHRGRYIGKLEFSDSRSDVEAVASYDEAALLYVGEESKRRVTAYHMPATEVSDSRNGTTEKATSTRLEEAFSFTLEAPEGSSTNNGLEGMTVVEDTGDIFCTNEKSPREIIHLSQSGRVKDTHSPDYCNDLSGLAYDRELKILWVLSDISERVFATDIDTGDVLDYWDLDFQNPEGIALNHNHDPPLLYITTDPSAPQGSQFVAALFIFEKPAIGSGLSFHSQCSFDNLCVGCDKVYGAANGSNESPTSRDSRDSRGSDDTSESSSNRSDSVKLMLAIFLPFFSVLFAVFIT